MYVPPSVRAAAHAGERLDQLLAREPLPLVRSLRIAAGAAQALGVLHDSGRWHGRLRPAALRLSPAADAVCLADPADPLCSVPDAGYQAPEQTGSICREPDHRCDFHALGRLLQAMLHAPVTSGSTADGSTADGRVAESAAGIAAKLLALMPEDRYQSAQGLLHDLHRCLHALEAGLRLDPFVLGTDDISDRFHPSHRLYGREAEQRLLHHAVDRVTADGRTEVMLVCGPAGVGKTALVQGLRAHAAARGAHLAWVACSAGSQPHIARVLHDSDRSAAHPQVLVLDDLQQADAASLAFIEPLLAGPRLARLLLIAVFRQDDLHAGHPLAALLSRLDRRGAMLPRLTLRPLRPADIERLLADTLHCEPSRTAALARRVFDETRGHPRDCHRVLQALHVQGLITFDHHRRGWHWDIARIDACRIAEAAPAADAAVRAELQGVREALAASRRELDATRGQLVRARRAAGIARDLVHPAAAARAHLDRLARHARDLLGLVEAYESADAAIATGLPRQGELIERHKLAIGLAALRLELPALAHGTAETVARLEHLLADMQREPEGADGTP